MFEEYSAVIDELKSVYLHDKRPWLIGYSGGKDSTLVCQLVFEMLLSLPVAQRNKKIYIVTSDTLVENPIIKDYIHKMSVAINDANSKYKLNVESHIVYPDWGNTFWSLIIGRGYMLPYAAGPRWCTDRLKITPSTKFTYETIEKNGEIVILLGVRKAESVTRANSINSQEIVGKLLSPHPQIPQAYVYRPIVNISNETIWAYLLKDEAQSAWGTDNRILFNLYQGETEIEAQSAIGEIDKSKLPIAGKSRFGCWVCSMVKDDKSLTSFITKGHDELKPLSEFRTWLIQLGKEPGTREQKRRNGSVYRMPSGELGYGPFTQKTRTLILEKLLELEEQTGFSLICEEELKVIDQTWDAEGDLTCRTLVETYYKIKKKRLPWDPYKYAKYDEETVNIIRGLCDKYDVSFELLSQLMLGIDKTKFCTRTSVSAKEVERILNQGWLHDSYLREKMPDADSTN